MNFIEYFPSNPKIGDKDFYQKIYSQKEFYDLALPGESMNFLHHQLVPQRFLSPWSFYQSLLLVHETGTGKSGCVSAVLDVLKNHDKYIPMIYVTNNETLIKNFKQELLKLTPWIQTHLRSSPNEKINTFFRKFRFYFTTFGSFEKDIIQKIPVSYLKKVFIVLDEAHHLVTKYMKNYDKIFRFLKTIPERKLMVMTATPMRDDSIELIYLLNLVLPIPFPTGQEFVQEYLTVHKNNEIDQYSWKHGKDVEFRQKIKGYVSVFRQKIENVAIQYAGKPISKDFSTNIFIDKMHPFQEMIYMKTWNKDVPLPSVENTTEEITEESVYDTLYNQSIQSSLMVFPNGKFGSNAVKDYMVDEKRFSTKFFKESGMILNPKSEKDIKENLKHLFKYSTVYHSVISSILKAKEQGKLIYVYSEKINNSGILRCIFLLIQCFNFSHVSSNSNKSNILSNTRERLIFLHDDDTLGLIKMFNDSKNKHGDYIRVIFGTDKTTEGITLKNIQQIHIVTPGWNFGKKNQAEGRGYRFGSHLDLGAGNITLQIYLHCASPGNINDSVNYLQYCRSEIKERNILLFSYALMVAAIDCQINYYQNHQKNTEDYSTGCYLEKCDYHCDGISKKDLSPSDIFYGNYNSFFVNDDTKVKSEIEYLFQIDPQPKSFDELFHCLQHFRFSKFQIFYGIMKMISTPIKINLLDGQSMFLSRYNDIIYITPTRDTNIWGIKGPLELSQFSKPHFRLSNTCTSSLNYLFRNTKFLTKKLEYINSLFLQNDKYKIVKYFQCLPMFLQNIMIKKYPNFKILQTSSIDEKNLSVQLPTSRRTATSSPKPNTATEIPSYLDKTFGFYGIREKDTFKIRDLPPPGTNVDKRKLPKGQMVKTIEIIRLIRYITILKQKIDDNLQSFLPSESDAMVRFYLDMKQELVDESFQREILSKYSKVFNNSTYSLDEKRLILFLHHVFGLRRQPLIAILENEILKKNIMV